MIDLYKQLGVPDSADDNTIRAALPAAAPTIREAARFILLDPGRREVYDRNRRVLATVGRLRSNLGLNLTRFWPRARFADFTIDLTPPPARRGRALDPMTMAWAFGVHPDKPRRPLWRRKRTILLACVVVALVAAALMLWWSRRAA